MIFIYFIKTKIESLKNKLRVLAFYYFFGNLRLVIGKNLRIRGGKGVHRFGDNLKLYDNVIIECHSTKAKIETGKNCILSYGVILSCSNKILLGNDVWIGEYCSLRDSTHLFSSELSLSANKDYSLPIVIGNNVWIGRGSIVLPGTVIGDNVIIGANSLVKGYCEKDSLYAGSPAKFKKKLNETNI